MFLDDLHVLKDPLPPSKLSRKRSNSMPAIHEPPETSHPEAMEVEKSPGRVLRSRSKSTTADAMDVDKSRGKSLQYFVSC